MVLCSILLESQDNTINQWRSTNSSSAMSKSSICQMNQLWHTMTYTTTAPSMSCWPSSQWLGWGRGGSRCLQLNRLLTDRNWTDKKWQLDYFWIGLWSSRCSWLRIVSFPVWSGGPDHPQSLLQVHEGNVSFVTCHLSCVATWLVVIVMWYVSFQLFYISIWISILSFVICHLSAWLVNHMNHMWENILTFNCGTCQNMTSRVSVNYGCFHYQSELLFSFSKLSISRIDLHSQSIYFRSKVHWTVVICQFVNVKTWPSIMFFCLLH